MKRIKRVTSKTKFRWTAITTALAMGVGSTLPAEFYSQPKTCIAVTQEEISALQETKNYLESTSYSRESIKVLLTIGEKYSEEEIEEALNNCGADWKKQAQKAAKGYLAKEIFSKKNLKAFLISSCAFTEAQAKFGVKHCGADWQEQAIGKLSEYLDSNFVFTKTEVRQKLMEDDGFTKAQVNNAIKALNSQFNSLSTPKKRAAKLAKSLLEEMSMSKKMLKGILRSDGYTKAQAKFGVNHCGADWQEQAVKVAKEYLEILSYTKEELLEFLIHSERFTKAQAEYAIKKIFSKK